MAKTSDAQGFTTIALRVVAGVAVGLAMWLFLDALDTGDRRHILLGAGLLLSGAVARAIAALSAVKRR